MVTRLFFVAMRCAALFAGALVGISAAAQSTWNVYSASPSASNGGSSCVQNSANVGSFNNSYGCTSTTGGTAGSKMTISAWSADADRGVQGGINGTGFNGTSKTSYYGESYYLSPSAAPELAGSQFASAYLSPQGTSGFGSTSRLEAQKARANGDTTPLDPTSPNHSFDSIAPGSYDLLLLNFDTKVVLDKIGIGWTQGDADITLLRWDGTAPPTFAEGSSSMTGDGHQNLTALGWTLVGSYADLGMDGSMPFGGQARSTGATKASSWWLISSFNTTLNGGSTSCRGADGTTPTTCDGTNDSFKLNYIVTKLEATTQGGGVPEPGSLALAGIALAGAISLRRRAGLTK